MQELGYYGRAGVCNDATNNSMGGLGYLWEYYSSRALPATSLRNKALSSNGAHY
jgi:hypothetical protein